MSGDEHFAEAARHRQTRKAHIPKRSWVMGREEKNMSNIIFEKM
jgi:hypothetical protein